LHVLGISAFYHDSAAAIVADGRIIAAAQEERFTRKRHDAGFPSHAIAYCLEASGRKLTDIDYIVFYDKPFLKFERLLETYLAFAPKGFTSFRMAMPIWLKEKLFQKSLLGKELRTIDAEWKAPAKLLFTEHHQLERSRRRRIFVNLSPIGVTVTKEGNSSVGCRDASHSPRERASVGPLRWSTNFRVP
jgi:carbamoyltransferase